VFLIFEPYIASPELAPTTLLIVLEILAKIGACGPGIIALILTLILNGKSGLRDFVSRIFKWKVNPIYYLFALLMPIVIFMIPLSIELMLGESFPNTIAEYGLIGFIFHYLSRLLLGNYEEEIGWRGFAQHHLQKTYSPIKMSLIIGVPHAIWHIPMFLIESGSIDLLIFLIYTIRVIFFTFLVTWLYSKTQSVLLTALLHVTVNESSLFLAVNTIQGILILMVIIAIIGIILILFFAENRTNVDDIVET
jgi:membrane protease YdiL (CAAX protease family)